MRMVTANYTSSQQAPRTAFKYEQKYQLSTTGSMFIDDFSAWFSSEFTPIGLRSDSNFYTIYPEDASLTKLLWFNGRFNLDYNLDTIFSQIVRQLILNGRAYLEIIFFKDFENVIKGINFVPINAKKRKNDLNHYTFQAIDWKNVQIEFSVESKYIVEFDLRDLGYGRNYFRRLLKKLANLDVTKASQLTFDSRAKEYFNFKEYVKITEYDLLKFTNNVHWLGRNYSNQHLSESYLLYRKIKFKILRYEFLKYILEQINCGLDRLKEEWGFTGNIGISFTLPDYNAFIKKYESGEYNASKLGDIVIQNIIPTDQ